MKNKRKSFISDADLDKEFLENLLCRSLEQKFQYLEEWAKAYYWGVEAKDKGQLSKFLTGKDYSDFFIKNIQPDKEKKVAVISLGCGNANPEKYLLQQLQEQGYSFSYFGVDSSAEMLDLAEENLKDLKIDKQFILADITTEQFEAEIDNLVKNYDQRVYCFLGVTFGNPNQTKIADNLYHLLEEGDFLWLDIFTRTGIKAQDNLKIFSRYEKYLNNEKEMASTFYPLKRLGINRNAWKIGIHMIPEDEIWALKFLFFFKFKEKTEIFFRGRVTHIGKKQKIDLLHIRIYYLDLLKEFLECFSFKIIDIEVKETGGGMSPVAQLILSR